MKNENLINDSCQNENNVPDNVDTSKVTSGTPPTPGGPQLPNRIQACAGKKYGDFCIWYDSNGIRHDGKCIYNKWGINNGELFCANADYYNEEDAEMPDSTKE